MRHLIENFRLYWWRRAYRKVWSDPLIKNSPTCSTKTEAEAQGLSSFIRGNLDLDKIKTVLDVGCGNGKLGDRIFKEAQALIQTDYCAEALGGIDLAANPKKDVIRSEAGKLPFKDNIFDCVFLYSLIHYAGSLRNAKYWIIDMLRLLKRGGVLYIGDVPIRKMLRKRLKQKLFKIRNLDDIKYYFAEFTQYAFSVDDFLGIDGVGQLRVIIHPRYLRFHTWRLDVEIKKQ